MSEGRWGRPHARVPGLRWRAVAFVAVCAVLLASAVPAANDPVGIDRGPGYATSTWVTLHGDSSNRDSVPFATSTDLRLDWRALEGAGIVVAPVIAHDGTLFVTTGRGAGSSHLHALSPSGSIVWESAPQRGPDDLDSGAVLSAPILGDDGGVYVGDSNQFFAFEAAVEVEGVVAEPRWVASLAEHGVEGPFVTGVMLGDRVGGITVHGHVILFDRATGALAAPVLELPGGASPEGPVPEFAWREGLIDESIRRDVLDVLLGQRFEVTNTPAVHPDTQRIFLLAAGPTPDAGTFYGIDLVEAPEVATAGSEPDAATRLEIAFATPTAPGTGTSPAISPDGAAVYAYGGDGEILAIDSTTGDLLFELPVAGLEASPTVAPDGAIYILAADGVKKLDGRSGEIRWARNYDAFARERMPRLSWWRPFVRSGKPIARADSVLTVTPNAVWAALIGGYELKVAGHEIIHAVRAWLVALDPRSGDLIASYPLPDTSEGAISVGRGGEIYLDLLALQSSLAAAAPYARWLPRELHADPPRGGIVAFEPRSRTAQLALGLTQAGDLLAGAPIFGPSDRLRAVRAQLEAVQWLGVGYDVSAERAAEVGHTLGSALGAAERCADGERGPEGCAALADFSRELRLLGGSLHSEVVSAPAAAP